MRNKTAKHTTKRRADSPPKQSGLIAKGKNSQRSARTKSALDNRSHRTTRQISCERKFTSFVEHLGVIEFTMRANRSIPQRLSASFA